MLKLPVFFRSELNMLCSEMPKNVGHVLKPIKMGSFWGHVRGEMVILNKRVQFVDKRRTRFFVCSWETLKLCKLTANYRFFFDKTATHVIHILSPIIAYQLSSCIAIFWEFLKHRNYIFFLFSQKPVHKYAGDWVIAKNWSRKTVHTQWAKGRRGWDNNNNKTWW